MQYVEMMLLNVWRTGRLGVKSNRMRVYSWVVGDSFERLRNNADANATVRLQGSQ